MPKYIKSHSNYVLKKRHQDINDGTIWERDITTIGGVNQFAKGQIPIYRSSNFIITVRDDGKIANQYNQTKWKENGLGNIWTLENISGITSEFEDQNDVKIILKQDYYDFCDFAYYGSLTEMFRASINDIFNRFPGELYGTNEYAYYTSGVTDDFNKIEGNVPLGKPISETTERKVTARGGKCIICPCVEEGDTLDTKDRYVDNPFGIDVHSIKKPLDGKELKFFANNGYKNYQIINGDGDSGNTVENWQTRNFIKVVKYESVLDSIYGMDAFYYDYLKPEVLQTYFDRPDNEIWWMQNNNNNITEKGKDDYKELEESFANGEIRQKFIEYDSKYWIEKIVTPSEDCGCTEYSVYAKFFDTEREAIEALPEDEEHTTYVVRSGAMCGRIECYIGIPCKGYKAASVTADTVIIGAWVGDHDQIVYLSDKGNMNGIHLRPIDEFIVQFYNECDNFEKLILDRKSTPKYKASFSVIKESEMGYYRDVEDFIFPTSYGNYNVDASSFGFNDYTSRLSEIGNYYDSFFTDNLYRSMTHEAIKNFDWTYTREFVNGAEEEYVHGGEKVQKALRIFAREFDEILSYINNIKNYNRLTYDERSNVPDYFLLDSAEKSGWDVCLVYPYELKEYVINADGTKRYIEGEYEEKQQLDNKDGNDFLKRQFVQNTKREVTPYKSDVLDYPYGYFIVCGDGESPCWYDGMYGYLSAEGSGSTYYDSDSGKLLNRIKSYSSEKKYSYIDTNNEFMRRLVINSPYIWRHKGTIEGIEMILGMFGLKSKKWVDKLEKYRQDCEKHNYDYEIIEYSSFTNRIEEKWDAVHQMYRIDWINSTKTIVYDYRSTSNYTQYGAPTDYLSYQGLPISFRNEYILTDENDNITNEPYIKVSPLLPDEEQESTNDENNAFKTINENNSPVIRRYIYPNFDKYEQLDGNPYFQMDGGWLSKTVQNTQDDSGRYNFQYDVDDNIAYTCYVSEGSDENEIIDNHYIFKETVRNIRRVDTIADLITIPFEKLIDGTICYVSNVERDIAIIDNEVFAIKYEYNPNDETKPLRYVSLIKGEEYIKIGDSKFFNDTIIVFDKDGNEATYTVYDKQNGYEVKAYIKDDNGVSTFICKSDNGGMYTIDSFMILDEDVTSATTNYFIIDNIYYSDRLASNGNNNGWRRLNETDSEYIRVNTITNYYEGNNPHNGNMVYDNGHNYFTYFKRLFKNPIDEDLFDERCYEAFYYDLDNEIVNYGFKNLIHDNEMIRQYFPYISGLTDTKIHYFGNYYERDDSSDKTMCEKVMFYGENENKRREMEKMYKSQYSKITVNKYILNNEDKMISGTPYVARNMKEIDGSIIDEVTNQVMNNKRLTIKFYLHDKWHKNQGQTELKYLDSIVMNYLTQMIPSTTIVEIQYISNGDATYQKRLTQTNNRCVGYNMYEQNMEQVSRDNGQTWEDTGQLRLGSLITENSKECGYVEPQTPPEPPTPQPKVYYKWVDEGTVCDNGDKYKIEKKVQSEDGINWTDVEPREERRALIEKNSQDCGYIQTQERWIEDGTMCVGTTKYVKLQKQISNDMGTTWTNVSGQIKEGKVLEYDSADCGYSPITYRWVGDGTMCFEGNKCVKLKQQKTEDGGITWTDTEAIKHGEVVEYDSPDCSGTEYKVYTVGRSNSPVTVYCEGDKPYEITSHDVLGNERYKNDVTAVTIGKCATSIGDSAFWATDIKEIAIPTNITSIGMYAFSDCYYLKSVGIPNSVTSIGMYAFSRCHELTNVSIPNTIKTIPQDCFMGCESITSITIPVGVETIKEGAFVACIGMTSITLSNTITSITDNALNECYFTIDNFINDTGLDAEANNYWGATIVDSDRNGILVKGDMLVKYRCTNDNVVIPNGITKIRFNAFNGCNKITSVTIPDSVTEIGSFAFSGCTNLKNVVFGNGITTIPCQSFMECTSLTSLVIPNNVTVIDISAFEHCNALTSVTLGNNVTIIANGAFQYCSNLVSITILTETPPTLGGTAFRYVDENFLIYVPRNCVETYQEAESWNRYAERIRPIE